MKLSHNHRYLITDGNQSIGEHPGTGNVRFVPPAAAEPDFVLILERGA